MVLKLKKIDLISGDDRGQRSVDKVGFNLEVMFGIYNACAVVDIYFASLSLS